ncbi:head-tail connector protein [Pseudovibrio flavus]|uniref:head-tail connector protein n=1 Tax=Pseudovibrio flavus TaxID=2529854 RepID=UPI00211C45A8|nr:head-tail connector protein [Pseudovibrio flavus]
MSTLLLTPPATEPVTLADVHMHLRLSHTHEDGLLTTLIKAARQQVEQKTGRALIAQKWRLYLDKLPQDRCIRLPHAPLASLVELSLYDPSGMQHVIGAGQILTDPASNPPRVKLQGPVPFALREMMGVEVDYIAGYGSLPEEVPESLRTAVLMLVAFWYERRSHVEDGLLTGLIPHGFDAALSPYKVLRL